MTSMLHISDPHFETWDVMPRLNKLAHFYSDCAAVALTGDCTSSRNTQLPEEWNEWPQPLKLSVPGNHDKTHTFDLLHTWQCLRTQEFGRERLIPLVYSLNDLVFIGVDTSKYHEPFSELANDLGKLEAEKVSGGSAVILLTHKWPELGEDEWIGEMLKDFVANRVLLVLHGHKHPWYADGTEWESSAKIGNLSYYRSKVISCQKPRGRGHLITWENNQFTCKVVQG